MSAAPQMNPFDPALIGTPDHRWQDVLVHSNEWLPPKGPLLVVSPHPDDEVLGAGGLMRRWALQGERVTVLSVTDGEAAYPDWTDLGQVRRQEFDDALAVLSERPIVNVRLNIPDGQVRDHVVMLFDKLTQLVVDRPTLIAPYELDGHPDHDVTGAVCYAVARIHRLLIARYPIWAWHHRVPEHMAACQWRRVELDTDTQKAKAAAIQCFASQLRPVERSPIVPHHVLPYFNRTYESFLL